MLFESEDREVTLPVEFDHDTVWLTRNQLAELYGRDVKTIGKHIANALREELAGEENRTVAKFATTAADGKTYSTEHYSLEPLARSQSIGYGQVVHQP